MAGSKKKRVKLDPIPAYCPELGNVGVWLISDKNQVIGVPRRKKRKAGKMKAARIVPRPSLYGGFGFYGTTYEWGFSMPPVKPTMRASRVVIQPGGIVTAALREKAMASIGCSMEFPNFGVIQTRIDSINLINDQNQWKTF